MKNKPNPLHRKETEWQGEVCFVEGEGLSPDDPEFKRRARRDPGVAAPRTPKKRYGKKKK